MLTWFFICHANCSFYFMDAVLGLMICHIKRAFIQKEILKKELVRKYKMAEYYL